MSAIEKAREAIAQALAQLGKDFIPSTSYDDQLQESKQTETCKLTSESLEQVTKKQEKQFEEQTNTDDDLAIVRVEAPAEFTQLPSTVTAWKHALDRKNRVLRTVRAKRRSKKALKDSEIDLLDEYYRPAPLTTLINSAEPEEGECSSSSSSRSQSPLHKSSVSAEPCSSGYLGPSSRYDLDDQCGLNTRHSYDRPKRTFTSSPHGQSPRGFRSRSRSPYRGTRSRSRLSRTRYNRSRSRSSSALRHKHQRSSSSSRSRSFSRKRRATSRSRSRFAAASRRHMCTMQTQTHSASLEVSAARLRLRNAAIGARKQQLSAQSTKQCKSKSKSRSTSTSTLCRRRSTSTASSDSGSKRKKHGKQRKRGGRKTRKQHARKVRSCSDSSSTSSSSKSSSSSESEDTSDSETEEHQQVKHAVSKREPSAQAALKRVCNVAKGQLIARTSNSLSTNATKMSKIRAQLMAERRKFIGATVAGVSTEPIKGVQSHSLGTNTLVTTEAKQLSESECTGSNTVCHSNDQVAGSEPVRPSKTGRVSFKHIEEAQAELINQLAAIERTIAEKRAMLNQVRL